MPKPRKEKKEKTAKKRKDIRKSLSKRLAYQFPLLLLLSLLFFAIIQFIGERLGILPVITLSRDIFFGSESIIFFIITISLSLFLGFMISQIIILRVNNK